MSSLSGQRRRLAGHTLAFEGAPHDEQGRRLGWSGVAGYGRARCSCGELSEELPSGALRRAWHVDHKAALAPTTPRSDR